MSAAPSPLTGRRRSSSRPAHPGTPESRTLVVGLGGNAGSGKSEVARELRRLGAQVIDADRIGWSLLRKGTATWTALVRTFGRGFLDARGNIDRRRLGTIVFADEQKLARLNRIVHPALLREIRRQVQAASRNPRPATGIVVIDAALLFDWNLWQQVDLAVMVSATRRNKLARLIKSGLSRTEARSRLSRQIPEEETRRLAHIILVNNGTRTELLRKVRGLWQLLVAAHSAILLLR